jgi:hypothetical protein
MWARTGAGLALGACSAAVHLLLTVPVAAALLAPTLRPKAEAAVRRMAAQERRP